jgi:hypothetical protein
VETTTYQSVWLWFLFRLTGGFLRRHCRFPLLSSVLSDCNLARIFSRCSSECVSVSVVGAGNSGVGATSVGTNLISIANPSLPRNRSLRGKRLPEDWRPLPADEGYARSLLGDSGFAITLENFRDYWLSRADAGAIKLDWARTWRRWCRKDAQDNSKRKHWGDVTVADAQQRIRDGTADAADVRLVKDHHKLDYGLMLKGMRRSGTNSIIEEFIKEQPRRGPDHDGPTIDAEAQWLQYNPVY